MIKKISILLLVLASLFVMGCSDGSGTGGTVTQEQAAEAYGLTQGAYLLVALSLGLGGTVEGATLDAATGSITFTNFDVVDLSSSLSDSYSTMSGSATPTDTSVSYNFTLTGGPVNTISYTFDGSQTNVQITANGQTFSFDITG